MEPLSAGIIAGGALLSGLVSGLFGISAADQSVAAQRESNMLNYGLAQEEQAEDTRRFNISNALANLRIKMEKEQMEWTKEQAAEAKQAQQALGFSNRLVQLGNEANLRGQGLAGQWAAQSKLR